MILDEYLNDVRTELYNLKSLTEKGLTQVSDEDFFKLIDPEANSIAQLGMGAERYNLHLVKATQSEDVWQPILPKVASTWPGSKDCSTTYLPQLRVVPMAPAKSAMWNMGAA